MPERQADVDVATACSVLESDYRRDVLRALAAGSGTTTRAGLARTLSGDDRVCERVDAALYHTHLPKLVDGGAIRYDPDSGRVALTAAGERFVRCLDAMERELGGGR